MIAATAPATSATATAAARRTVERLRPDLPDRQRLGRQGHATIARLAKFEP